MRIRKSAQQYRGPEITGLEGLVRTGNSEMQQIPKCTKRVFLMNTRSEVTNSCQDPDISCEAVSARGRLRVTKRVVSSFRFQFPGSSCASISMLFINTCMIGDTY